MKHTKNFSCGKFQFLRTRTPFFLFQKKEKRLACVKLSARVRAGPRSNPFSFFEREGTWTPVLLCDRQMRSPSALLPLCFFFFSKQTFSFFGKSWDRTNNPWEEPTFQIGAITILPFFHLFLKKKLDSFFCFLKKTKKKFQKKEKMERWRNKISFFLGPFQHKVSARIFGTVERKKWKSRCFIMRTKNSSLRLFQKSFSFFFKEKSFFFGKFFPKEKSMRKNFSFFCPRISCIFVISIHRKKRFSPLRRTKKSWVFTMCHFFWNILKRKVLGREDSNLWMLEPKPSALPLGDTPFFWE